MANIEELAGDRYKNLVDVELWAVGLLHQFEQLSKENQAGVLTRLYWAGEPYENLSPSTEASRWVSSFFSLLYGVKEGHSVLNPPAHISEPLEEQTP